MAPSRLGLTLLFALISLIFFVTLRHLSLQRRRLLAHSSSPPTPGHGTAFFTSRTTSVLIALGSGGHTKEMLLMLEAGFGRFRHMHRTYLVSTGDHHSLQAMRDFEAAMAAAHGADDNDNSSTGTYDAWVVRRARKVHQPLVTTPFSATASFLNILPRLLRRRPDLVLTNGPATGFFVGAAAYLLRVFWLVPETKLRVVYVESWARVRTLSLTGKLFYHIGLADAFLVQHEPVARAYNVTNAGWLVAAVPRRDVLSGGVDGS